MARDILLDELFNMGAAITNTITEVLRESGDVDRSYVSQTFQFHARRARLPDSTTKTLEEVVQDIVKRADVPSTDRLPTERRWRALVPGRDDASLTEREIVEKMLTGTYGILLDMRSNTATVRQAPRNPIQLMPDEAHVLSEILRRNGSKIMGRELAERVWPPADEKTADDVHQRIRRLRHKLGAAAEFLESKPRVGYWARDLFLDCCIVEAP